MKNNHPVLVLLAIAVLTLEAAVLLLRAALVPLVALVLVLVERPLRRRNNPPSVALAEPGLRGPGAGGCNNPPPAALRGRPPLRCNNPPPAAPEAPLSRRPARRCNNPPPAAPEAPTTAAAKSASFAAAINTAPQPHPLATLATELQALPVTRLRAMAGIRSKRHTKAALVAMVAACSC